MSVEVKKIVKFCEDYLKVKEWQDGCTNGLQVEGADKTSRIISGVSLSEALIKEAIKKRTELLLVHHGLFDRNFPPPISITGAKKDRLKLLLENDINLVGFHIPLDANPVIGNNISLIKLFGLKKTNEIVDRKHGLIGYIGEYSEAMNYRDFINLVNEKLSTESYTVDGGPKKVKKVGVVSGGPADGYLIAHELGADTFLTGEILEGFVRESEELGINYIAAGHYNTEKLGIKNLGALAAKKFGIKHEFIDIPCDV